MKKVVYLESQQNLVWTSMQEIFPSIKETWETYSQEKNKELHIIDVDKETPQKQLAHLLQADVIVVSSFNGRMAQFLEIIRLHLKIDAPWVFYLHGLATVGLWPLKTLGLSQAITSKDVLVGTCEGDKRCLNIALPKACYFQTHFHSSSEAEDLVALNSQDINDLVYIGRLSRQKNLHLLLWCFSLLKRSRGPESDLVLHLYGKGDELDAPNMGLKRKSYVDYLKELSQKLGLKEGKDIFFHGFVKRDVIFESLKKQPFLFVSLSLHSDENFGMASLMALKSGGRLLLSQWGGHQNFQKFHSLRTSTIPVHLGDNGPFLNPNEALFLIEKSLQGKAASAQECWCTLENAVNNLGELESLIASRGEVEKIEFSPIVDELVHHRSHEVGSQDVFDGYSDTNAHKFFEAYGAQKGEPMKKLPNHFELAPWMKESSQGEVSGEDPHRGDWSGSLLEALNCGYLFEMKES